jgi:hypothetical protein
MQFVQTKQDEQRRSAAAVSRKGTKLSMYGTPPEEEVTLEEFEGVAIDRLRGAAQRRRRDRQPSLATVKQRPAGRKRAPQRRSEHAARQGVCRRPLGREYSSPEAPLRIRLRA